ncbi:WD40-repeat-containing domain protein [Roridomyces roridus]|uniref:WD40-repeat-containing domain protein n=1 Tax=Roridomyces roridus TaxID=1738132 RepID=A0AAD7CGM5_9AGAR|nr:WD40-repeat-containing domain protein [Roridomyces roridus]
MHPMPSHGLITSSLQYGIVSRSFPFTGAVLRGYLDAAGSGGLGIGNPNTEFSPNVSACALGSDGGTAKIVWGFRNGEVAFTAANKAMDAGRRSAARFTRCKVEEQHFGVVLHAIWDGTNAVSAGGDGRVKLWDATPQCVWTSECHAPDKCVKVASALNKDIIAAAMRSGDIIVWSPVGPTSVQKISIPCPIRGEEANRQVSGLFIDNSALLVTYTDSHLFYRFDVDFSTDSVQVSHFGDPALGAITCCFPSFADQPEEHSLVITGTQLGCVGIYAWADKNQDLPVHKFEAYEDGASVTALAWNGVTLATGCARGTTKAWDALTLELLRVWATPIPRKRATPTLMDALNAEDPKVRQILLGADRETMFVAVGDRVMAFRAGPVPKGGALKVRGSPGKKRERTGTSKYHQQLEMNEEIVESRHLLQEESRYAQRAYGRAREQRAGLETLGLDEVEAVEYVLMLSREEAMERERQRPPIEEGVFEGDFDEVPAPAASRLSPSPPSSAPSPTEALWAPSPPSPRSLPPPRVPAHFPAMSSSASSRASVSPRAKSAWSTPLGGRSPVPSPGTSFASSNSRVMPSANEDMDDDLRFAIELSLAEARSRAADL